MVDQLDILNVNEGDTKLTFDENDPEDREEKEIIKDMLKKGFYDLYGSNKTQWRERFASCQTI